MTDFMERDDRADSSSSGPRHRGVVMCKELFRRRRVRGKIIVLDGAFATECQRLGVNIDHPLWGVFACLAYPDVCARVHQGYFEAGCDVVTCGSYQLRGDVGRLPGLDANAGVVPVLGASSEPRTPAACPYPAPGTAFTLQEETSRCQVILAQCAQIAVRARNGLGGTAHEAMIAASLGPFGCTVGGGGEFTGDYSAAALPPGMALRECETILRFHRTRLTAAIACYREGLFDMLLLETTPRLDEALLMLRLVKDICAAGDSGRGVPIPPVIVSFTLHPSRAGCVASGETFATVWTELGKPEFRDVLVGIGCNCCDPAGVDAVVKEVVRCVTRDAIDATSEIALALYPNSGEVYLSDTNSWGARDERAATHVTSLHQLLEKFWLPSASVAGVPCVPLIVGGCCRTTAADVRALAAWK